MPHPLALLDLPIEIIDAICQHLDIQGLRKVLATCHLLRNIGFLSLMRRNASTIHEKQMKLGRTTRIEDVRHAMYAAFVAGSIEKALESYEIDLPPRLDEAMLILEVLTRVIKKTKRCIKFRMSTRAIDELPRGPCGVCWFEAVSFLLVEVIKKGCVDFEVLGGRDDLITRGDFREMQQSSQLTTLPHFQSTNLSSVSLGPMPMLPPLQRQIIWALDKSPNLTTLSLDSPTLSPKSCASFMSALTLKTLAVLKLENMEIMAKVLAEFLGRHSGSLRKLSIGLATNVHNDTTEPSTDYNDFMTTVIWSELESLQITPKYLLWIMATPPITCITSGPTIYQPTGSRFPRLKEIVLFNAQKTAPDLQALVNSDLDEALERLANFVNSYQIPEDSDIERCPFDRLSFRCIPEDYLFSQGNTATAIVLPAGVKTVSYWLYEGRSDPQAGVTFTEGFMDAAFKFAKMFPDMREVRVEIRGDLSSALNWAKRNGKLSSNPLPVEGTIRSQILLFRLQRHTALPM